MMNMKHNGEYGYFLNDDSYLELLRVKGLIGSTYTLLDKAATSQNNSTELNPDDFAYLFCYLRDSLESVLNQLNAE